MALLDGVLGNASEVDATMLEAEFSKVLATKTGGHFDLDAELKVWVSGSSVPFQKKFNKRLSIYDVQSVLASYVLK